MEERLHTDEPDALELIEAVRGLVPAVMRKHQSPGLNIALADKGRLIWEAGFGLADVAAKAPMTCDTVYHSGSLGKTYTATAVMVLVDRGVVGLDDPINRHLPFEVRNPLGARDVTVRDLLTHRSGLGTDAAGPSFAPGPGLRQTLEHEYAQTVSPIFLGAGPRWANPVGQTWLYSNLGIATLGLIVETANPERLSFSEFVADAIMAPLKMDFSCYPPAQHPDFVPPHIWSRLSRGYARMGHADIPTPTAYFTEYPAGGTLQRPADHLRLLLAMNNLGELDGCRLFSKEIARAMISPAVEAAATPGERLALQGFEGHQGLVWRLNDVGLPWMSFDHAGGHMWGWQTQGRGWPAYGAALMVAVNQWPLPRSSSEPFEMADLVGQWLRHRPARAAESLQVLSAGKLSFVRGALLAMCSGAGLGMETEIPQGHLDAMIDGVRSRGDDWDPEAFRRGFSAAWSLPRALPDLVGFWTSPVSEVTLEEAYAARARLGGLNDASDIYVAAFFPPRDPA